MEGCTYNFISAALGPMQQNLVPNLDKDMQFLLMVLYPTHLICIFMTLEMKKKVDK